MTRILYVEDNDDNVYMLKLRFELLDGFEVMVAEDGEAGCTRAISEKPDLILIDLDLPVVDGWEASRRLKSNPATRDIPIIALSAHAMSGSREKALAAGCDEFDTKAGRFRTADTKDRLLAGKKTRDLIVRMKSDRRTILMFAGVAAGALMLMPGGGHAQSKNANFLHKTATPVRVAGNKT